MAFSQEQSTAIGMLALKGLAKVSTKEDTDRVIRVFTKELLIVLLVLDHEKELSPSDVMGVCTVFDFSAREVAAFVTLLEMFDFAKITGSKLVITQRGSAAMMEYRTSLDDDTLQSLTAALKIGRPKAEGSSQ